MIFKFLGLRILLIILALGCLISNYQQYKTSRFQSLIFSKNVSNKQSLFDSVNFYYPSLAFNSVPFTTYESQTYTNNENYDFAIELLSQSIKSNKYCLYSKYLLSRNYILKKEFSNAENILEELFYINPNNEITSSLYISLLNEMRKKEKLLSLKPILEEINDKLIWSYYSSAISSFN